MEKSNLQYLKKNIVAPTPEQYRLQLIAETEHVMKGIWGGKLLNLKENFWIDELETYVFHSRAEARLTTRSS